MTRRIAAVLLALTLTALPVVPASAQEPTSPCADPTDRPWCDPSLGPDERADLLLAAMTTEEKISLLAGEELAGAAGQEGTHTGTSEGIERLGIPTLHFSDGPVGTRQGQATQMPSPMSLASTFSPEAAARHAAVIGDEVRNKGNDVVFAPAVNMLRTPVNGRTFEYFGEDPHLAALMAEHWTRGVQSEGVIGNVKHYAVNNQEGIGVSVPGAPIGVGVIGSRMTLDAQVDERTMREIYLPPFEAAVRDGGVGTVMCAYNRVNGDYACQNEFLLTEVLREDWGFEGFVLTDYGAAKDTVASLQAGLDLDIWPGLVYNPVALQAALATGAVTIDVIDLHVHRILRTMFAFGVFDRAPYVEDESRIDTAAHHEVAADLAAEGMVLLRNDGNLLPLDADAIGTLAVIGPEADVIRDGGGSSAIDAYTTTTPLDALVERLGGDRVVTHDGSDPAAAAEVAAAADVALVVVGDAMTEGRDKSAPTLDADQTDGIDRDALISAVGAAQERTVAVLQAGGPVLTPWRDDVAAILQMWYPGQNGGTALARVLFGDVDPGGRLPATFPDSADDLPTAGDPTRYPGVAETAIYSEGVLIGYRHFDANDIEPAFAFGHGLSYTTFDHSELSLSRAPGSAAGATITFTVTNTGDRRGWAVPQVYVAMPQPSDDVVQPPQQLKGTARLDLAPGETATVTLALDERDLSYYDVGSGDWRVAPGCYGIRLGRSSRDIVDEAVLAIDAECPEAAPIGTSITRHGGPDRVATAAAIAGASDRDADVAVLATAAGYADALAGVPLAAHLDAPLLLTAPDGLSAAAASALRDRGTREVVVLGGEAAVSSQVTDDLEAEGITWRRVGGEDRFATAGLVVDELPPTGRVTLVEGAHADPGRGWPDALSAGALADPILLATRDALPAATAARLDDDVDVRIVGGTDAVSDDVAAEVDERAGDVSRIAGGDRYATSAAAADAAIADGAASDVGWLATGRDWPDGLSAGAAAGLVLLVDGQDPDGGAASRDWLAAHADGLAAVRIAGGPAAISSGVEAVIADQLRRPA
ncbi:glycoside hydrolase family 3 C-terminal domain-containing protein [Euzebya sp.]|uniref:glycoside hydrolase family 3 C-terminal domain-containing protein n=1 Tax=Euzebya sp. TaxID=1971409 RepID=UPI0035159AE4